MRQDRGERLRPGAEIGVPTRLCRRRSSTLRAQPELQRPAIFSWRSTFSRNESLSSTASMQVKSWSRAQLLVEFRGGRIPRDRSLPCWVPGGGAALCPSAAVRARQSQERGVLSLRVGRRARGNRSPGRATAHHHQRRRHCRRRPARFIPVPVCRLGSCQMARTEKEAAQGRDGEGRRAAIVEGRRAAIVEWRPAATPAAILPRRRSNHSRKPSPRFFWPLGVQNSVQPGITGPAQDVSTHNCHTAPAIAAREPQSSPACPIPRRLTWPRAQRGRGASQRGPTYPFLFSVTQCRCVAQRSGRICRTS